MQMQPVACRTNNRFFSLPAFLDCDVQVVQVEHKITGRVYALKVVDKHLILKNKQTEHISNERKLLDSFDYEGIVHLHFTFQDADSLYFGLELCPNGGHRPLWQPCQNGTSLLAIEVQCERRLMNR